MSSRKGIAVLLLLSCLGLSLIAPARAAFKVGVEDASAMKLQFESDQSCLVATGLKIRSVSVSNPEIAEVKVASPRQLKVTGIAPGSAILINRTETDGPTSVDVNVSGKGAKAGGVRLAALPAPETERQRNATTETSRESALREEPAFLVAVLPVENLSGRPGPLKEIRQSLTEGLKKRGIAVLPEGDLQKFMARHRMRYSGGINRELARVFLRETGTKAVLVTSLEYYSASTPPKIAFLSRLVSTGENPTVLWMNGIGISGDDHPGVLGLGLIMDQEGIQRKALGTALDSLARSLPEGMAKMLVRGVSGGKFRPRRYYRSPDFDVGGERPLTVAVIPFLNQGTRKNAGEVMALHFVSRLAEVGNVRVIEPGVVREELLRHRIIMQDGLSAPQGDLLFSMIEADLILAGNVSAYQDYEGGTGEAIVGFSVLAFDRKSQRMVWSSRSYNRGDDGVFFFGWGEVKTAGAMASQMAWAVIERIIGKG